MAAPILWAPGILSSFLQEDLHAHEIRRFSRDWKNGSVRKPFKEVFSLEESLESLKSLENGRTLLCFPESGGSLESLEWTFLKRPLFQKTPLSEPAK